MQHLGVKIQVRVNRVVGGWEFKTMLGAMNIIACWCIMIHGSCLRRLGADWSTGNFNKFEADLENYSLMHLLDYLVGEEQCLL